MKIVITGSNSYIGNHIQSYMQDNDKDMEICQLDVVGDEWRAFSFLGYDVVIHVAAIVHRKDVNSWDEYKKANVDLTEEIARKAKNQGVKQFVFLSSMAVYDAEKSLSKTKSIVTNNTGLNPSSLYGKSKYLAEQKLAELEDDAFKIAIVRPPNVYGPGCRGGYISTYVKVVKKIPVIPKAFTAVKQSILYIDNLCRFVYLLVVHQKNGIYTPQDDESVSAVKLMQAISEALHLNKKVSPFLGLFVPLLSAIPLVRKGYGGICYEAKMSHSEELDYIIVSWKEGIQRTVQYEVKCRYSGI